MRNVVAVVDRVVAVTAADRVAMVAAAAADRVAAEVVVAAAVRVQYLAGQFRDRAAVGRVQADRASTVRPAVEIPRPDHFLRDTRLDRIRTGRVDTDTEGYAADSWDARIHGGRMVMAGTARRTGSTGLTTPSDHV